MHRDIKKKIDVILLNINNNITDNNILNVLL